MSASSILCFAAALLLLTSLARSSCHLPVPNNNNNNNNNNNESSSAAATYGEHKVTQIVTILNNSKYPLENNENTTIEEDGDDDHEIFGETENIYNIRDNLTASVMWTNTSSILTSTLANDGPSTLSDDLIVNGEMATEVENISRALVVQFMMQQQLGPGLLSPSLPSSTSSAISTLIDNTTGNPLLASSSSMLSLLTSSGGAREPTSTKGHMADRALEAIQQALSAPAHGDSGFFFESPKGVWILADVIISLLAILANLVFIDAIRNIKLDLKGYRHFLINLSVTDIFTAIICLANFSHQAVSNHTQSLLIQKCGTNILRSLNIAGLLSNLLSLFGMSIDHYIGVFHPLRYQQIMGNARVVNFAIILIWLVSLLSAVVDSLVLLGFYFIGHDWSAGGARRGGLLANNHQGGTAASAATLSLLTFSTPASSTDSIQSSVTSAGIHLMEPTAATVTSTTTALSTDSVMTTIAVTNISGGNVTTSTKLLTERILSLMPLLQQDLSDLDTTAASTAEDFASTAASPSPSPSPSSASTASMLTTESMLSSTVRSIVASVSTSGDYAFPTEEVENFDPVEEIMNFVLPNDSSILEEFIKKIIKKDSEPHMLGWCSYHASEKLWFELFVIGLTVIIFSILIPIYCRILRQVMLTRGAHEWNARKLILTTLLLLGAFLLCRVPFVLFEVLMVVLMRLGYMRTNGSHLRMMDINNILNTMLMFFPLLDPIIYAIRMKAVQRYVFWRYGKCCPSMLWYCCGRDNIPDSQSVKRFSTFTYAMSRGSISGNSGFYGGPGAMAPGTNLGISQRLLSLSSVPSQSRISGSFDSTASDGRRPLLDRILHTSRLSRFFGVAPRSNRWRRGSASNTRSGSLRVASIISNNGNACRRVSGRSKHQGGHLHDEKGQRSGGHGDHEMLPLNQVHVEDEISDALSTMVEEPPLENGNNNNNNNETVLAAVTIAPSGVHQQQVDEVVSPAVTSRCSEIDQPVFSSDEAFNHNKDDHHQQNATDFIVAKLNNYLTKATKAVFDQQQQQQCADYNNTTTALDVDSYGSSKGVQSGGEESVNGNLSDVFLSPSQHSQVNDEDNTIIEVTPPAVDADAGDLDRRRRSSFYERLLLKVRRLRQLSSSPVSASSPFFGLFSATTAGNDTNRSISVDSTAYQPDVSLEIECIDCSNDNSNNNNTNNNDNNTGGIVNLYSQQPVMPLVVPSPRIFTKHYNTSHHRYHYTNNHHGSSNRALSNALILNKLALHTKKLFDLENKMLNISLSYPFPTTVEQKS